RVGVLTFAMNASPKRAHGSRPGACARPPGSHPNERMQVVLRGRARVHLGGEERVAGPGGLIHAAPPGVPHGIREVMEDFEVINCKEAAPGFSVKWARWEDEAAKRKWEAGR
ncbi:MAG: cupin domain-containing protein, partial [Nitrospinota bacterium]